MKLLIFGATGGTGRLLLEQALTTGHQVTAFVRNPARLSQTQAKLTTFQGDVLDAAAVARTVPGHEAVRSTLGVRTLFTSTRVLSEGMRNIVAAMQSAGVRRLIVESSYGAGEGDFSLGHRLVAATVLRGIFTDKARENDIIRNSGMDWTVVLPPTLTNGPRTGQYRVGEDLRLPFTARISRADVADFMLKQVAATDYIGNFVVVSY